MAADRNWTMKRVYASVIKPSKGLENPPPSICHQLKLADVVDVLTGAISKVSKQPFSPIVFEMEDDRTHPVRELLMKIAFGETKSPSSAMAKLATRLCRHTDGRTGGSLLVVTVDEAGDSRRVSLYVFPEENGYQLDLEGADEAVLKKLTTFVLHHRLRKVARFEGKNIASHFIKGEVVDYQIGTDIKTAAEYWVASFLKADFAINTHAGTTLVVQALKTSFEEARSPQMRAKVTDIGRALVTDKRKTWSLQTIADRFVPKALRATFCGVAPNDDMRLGKFSLNKELLSSKANLRQFELEDGTVVSAPFSSIGDAKAKKTVRLTGTAENLRLMASGRVIHDTVKTGRVRKPSKKERRSNCDAEPAKPRAS